MILLHHGMDSAGGVGERDELVGRYLFFVEEAHGLGEMMYYDNRWFDERVGHFLPPQHSDDAPVAERNRLVEIAVAVAGRVHQQELRWLGCLPCLDGTAQPASGVGHQPARVAENSLPGHVMPQTRGHRAAPVDVICHLVVAEVQQAGVNHGQVRLFPNGRGKLVGRSHDCPDVLPTMEELLQQQPSGRPACSNHQGRHLIRSSSGSDSLAA